VSHSDGEKKTQGKAETTFETTEIISTNVYRVSPEQNKMVDRLAEEKLEKARKEAIPNIQERYKRRQEELRESLSPKK